MKLLWFTWKDRKHPNAGGAEVLNEELAKRLTKKGWQVTFVVGGFKECTKEEEIHGYKIIRLGNRFTVYFKAWRYYKRHLQGKYDVVIDEVNTFPFFARFYVREKNFLFIHQLCREVWFYEIFFPLNVIGYILEPLYLWLLRKSDIITVSQSTKEDLIRLGFHEDKIHIISEGIEMEPLKRLGSIQDKEKTFTCLYFGSFRKMKRPDHVIRAFEKAKQYIPRLRLWLAGGGKGAYFKKCMKMIERSKYKTDITYFGIVSEEQKKDIMKKAHVICVPSVREGWGLVVTEANACGTPAVVYNVHGLRDSVKNGITGLLCKKNTPESLASAIRKMYQYPKKYDEYRKNAWKWSKELHFERSVADFIHILKCND